jgi:hypothetical protein
MFSGLLSQSDLLAPPLMSVQSAGSSDGSSYSDPPEHGVDQLGQSSSPQYQQPDMSKNEVDVFNEFLLGLADEYEVPVGDGMPSWQPDFFKSTTPVTPAQPSSASLYPSASALDSYTITSPPAQKAAYPSSNSMYPSLASVVDYPMPAFETGKSARQLPPARIAPDYRREPIYRRAEKLQAAPVVPGEKSEMYVDEPEEIVRTTNSLRSTYDSSSSRASSVSHDGEDAISSRSSADDMLRLAPMHVSAHRPHHLPSLRSVIGNAIVQPPTRSSTADKLAHVTDGVSDLDIAPPGKTRSFEETGATEAGGLPHKKPKVDEVSKEEELRRRRLATIKALVVLANACYRQSLGQTDEDDAGVASPVLGAASSSAEVAAAA